MVLTGMTITVLQKQLQVSALSLFRNPKNAGLAYVPQISIFLYIFCFVLFFHFRNFVCMKFNDLNIFFQDFWISEGWGKAVNQNGLVDIWAS